MLLATFRKLVASLVAVAMISIAFPAFAAPSTATLTGTVFGDNVSAPLAGATVVVTGANGAKLASQPTGADGSFTVAGVAAGTQNLAIETKDGAFAIATPLTLAPGETRGVQLSLRQASDDEKKKKKGAAAADPGATGAMVATIVGFAVMAGFAIEALNGDDNPTTASPSQPPPDGK